ncbi:helix-turn-helix domain-containing protein [Streptomyces phaeochromogenes]|uniref:helix-turn-helix domain-containing protein n=1 Tax=Streptomyces phaeochromogenes TaxID=1923 RepID=UPI002E288C16|nr:helix-turn-helix domain-containing protein [Streptomyces phaeochromogenes]
MAGKPFTDEEKKTLVELHGQGLSLNKIALTMDRSVGVISKYGKELGLPFDRTNTEAATAARTADLKTRRLALEEKLLSDAERLREQMWEPLDVHAFDVKGGGFVFDQIDEPTPRDKVDLIKAATYALNASIKLAEITSGNGEDDAKFMIGEFLVVAKAIAKEGINDEVEPESEAD